jgi:hypothetical protein
MAANLCIYKIEHRMQICLRIPIIACSTDHVGNIPLRELNLNLKIETKFEKFCVLSTIHVLIKADPTIPLSGRSKLVRQYL